MLAPDFTETPWRPWHTCLIGTSHRRELKNCQDATCVRESSRMRARTMIANGRCLVAAVSDGVGSLPFSEVGARVTATLAANIAIDGLHKGETVASPASLALFLAEQDSYGRERLRRLPEYPDRRPGHRHA